MKFNVHSMSCKELGNPASTSFISLDGVLIWLKCHLCLESEYEDKTESVTSVTRCRSECLVAALVTSGQCVGYDHNEHTSHVRYDEAIATLENEISDSR